MDLGRHIQWAREQFPTRPAFPPIDSLEIYLGDLVVDTWSPFLTAYEKDVAEGCVEELRESCETLIARDPLDTATRFVVLKFFYDSVPYNAVEKEDVVAPMRDLLKAHFAQLVRLRGVEECTDLKTIRWEIQNACAVKDWERLRELFLQIERLKLMPIEDLNLIRGQMGFQVLFDQGDDTDLSCWEAQVEPGISVRALSLYLTAVQLEGSAKEAQDADVVRDASNELAKGLAKKSGVSPAYRSMLARCYIAIGEFHSAAVEYRKLLSAGPWPDGELADPFHYLTLLALATALERDGATEEAMETIQKTIGLFPNRSGLCAKLARLQARKADYVAAVDSLLRECETDPTFGKDYRVEMLIALASVTGDSEKAVVEFENKLKAYAQSRPELSGLAAAILREHWPAFSQLSPDAQRDWIEATKMLHGQGDGVSLSGPAAFSFVLALENELRRLIFEPFRTEVGDECRRSTEKPPSAPLWYQHFRGYLQGGDKISLGDILCALRGTQSSNERWLEILGQWTARRFPSLFKCLMSLDTKKIVDTRNRHGHPGSREVSKSEAEEIAFSCRLLLDSLFTR